MTSESKILTVSYGTFSCTLEGFDDPFNTMKAIAEYFRDLTAEDRYFGAEPPQPDAAMLHRIAEREVSRLVDARVRENGVHLRPQVAEAAAPEMTPRVRTPRAQQPYAARPAEPVAEPTVEPGLQDDVPNGVAAKLARIRQSVNPQPFAAELPAEALAPFEAVEDAGPDAMAHDAEPLDDYAADTPIEDLAEMVAPQDGGDALADATDDGFSRDALTQLDALLRAPVEPMADAADGDLDLDAALVTEEDLADLAALDLPASVAADAVLEDRALEIDAPEVEFEAEADLAVETQADVGFDVEDDVAAAGIDAVEMQSDTLPEAAEDVPASLVEARFEDPLPEALVATDEAAEEAAELAAPATAEPPKPAGRSKRVNSRVVRLHPDADADDAADPQATRMLSPGGEDAEVARLLRQADDVMADGENRRRIDSIAQLKAAVVATEADRAVTGEARTPDGAKQEPYRDDLAHVVQPDPVPEPPQVKPRRKSVSVRPQEPRPGTIRPGMMGPPPLVLVSEQRIDRIAAPETPSELAPAAFSPSFVPQVSDASYQPEAQPAPGPQTGQPMVALRTGRLTGAIGLGAASANSVAPRQKLVLEQPSQSSADTDEDEDIDDDLSAAEQAGLVGFAERVGVTSMAEMLEAAAAYATCIENRSQFTRPQLMRRLMASAGDRTVSREDGLRSFGTLLRTGRIEKVSRGHYMLAETSPYLAEARRLS